MTRTAWFDDIATRLVFESEARRASIAFQAEELDRPGRLRYRFAIDVPVYDDRREAIAEFDATARPDDPHVFIDGPICQRHRYLNNALCMWLRTDPPEARWEPRDGLAALTGHVEQHAYCEAECRAGRAWPKPEAPGRHPRKPGCPACGGRGA